MAHVRAKWAARAVLRQAVTSLESHLLNKWFPPASSTTVDKSYGMARKNHKRNNKKRQLNPGRTSVHYLLTSLTHLLFSSTLNLCPLDPYHMEKLIWESVSPFPYYWPTMEISFTAQSSYWFHNSEREGSREKSKISNSLKFFNDWPM